MVVSRFRIGGDHHPSVVFLFACILQISASRRQPDPTLNLDASGRGCTLHAGCTLTHIGFLLALPSPTNAAFYATALALQVARIVREERVLMRDEAYRALAARVRYRLLPGVF